MDNWAAHPHREFPRVPPPPPLAFLVLNYQVTVRFYEAFMIVLYGKIPFIFSFNIHSQLLPLATIWEIKRHKHFKVTNEQTRAQCVALFVLMPLNKLTSRTYCVFYILLVFSTCYTQC